MGRRFGARALLAALTVTVLSVITALACSSGGAAVAHGGDAADERAGDAPSLEAATTGGDAPASCSADVHVDPRNCGSCGHDCHGGACAAGVCQPVTLD